MLRAHSGLARCPLKAYVSKAWPQPVVPLRCGLKGDMGTLAPSSPLFPAPQR